MPTDDPIRLDFICRKNAGRSQMAAAFAERERGERGLDDAVEIHSAGTEPADQVHEPVVEAMSGAGIDISDRTPTYPVLDHLKEIDILPALKREDSTVGVRLRRVPGGNFRVCMLLVGTVSAW